MRNERHSTEPLFDNQEARNTKGYRGTHKGSKGVFSSLSQQRLKAQPLQTNCRTYHCNRREDNTVWCKELGQTLPSTPQGDLDLVQLANEIAARKYFYPLR